MQIIYDFFNFVGNFIQTIAEGISGLITIISSLINLIVSITRILPNPLYPCFLGFITIFSTIFIYKIIRKG